MNLSDASRNRTADKGSRGGVHIVEWEFHGLKVTVSKLREQSNGGLLADFELVLQPYLLPDKKTWSDVFQYFTRFNLKSGQTKASTSKDLARVAPAEVVAGEALWRYVIEYVSNHVRTEFNKGEEGVELAHLKASDAPEYRLWPYCQERQPTVVFGLGNSGKSYFGILAGFLIATGREHLGMKPQQGNVCFLDYENDAQITQGRLRMVAAGFGEPIPEGFHYLHILRTLEDDFDRVNTFLMKHNIDFVVIDSAARAVFEAEQSGPVNQYFNALAGLEATTLTIAHVSKTAKESEPFGSTFWHNNARATFRALAQESGSTLTVGLRNYKSNNSPRISERAFQFTFEDAKVVVSKGDMEAIPGTEANAPMHRRIVTYLSNNGGPVTANDLAQTLDSTRGYITTVLNRELKGQVVHLPDGRWGLSIS